MKKWLGAPFALLWMSSPALAGGSSFDVEQQGSAAFAATQVSCASTATSFLSARTGASGTARISATIENTGTTAVYVGASGVTTSTGMLLPGIVGASLTINTTAALYCIVATGTETVTVLETY